MVNSLLHTSQQQAIASVRRATRLMCSECQTGQNTNEGSPESVS